MRVASRKSENFASLFRFSEPKIRRSDHLSCFILSLTEQRKTMCLRGKISIRLRHDRIVEITEKLSQEMRERTGMRISVLDFDLRIDMQARKR